MLDGGAAVHHDRQPAFVGDPRGLPIDDPELEPQTARPDLDGFAGVRHAQLGAAEDIDDVERAGRIDGLGQRPECRHAKDRPLRWIDRNALVALMDEIAEDAERRASLVR